MRTHKGRMVGHTILGAWLAAGLLMTGYGFLITGCAPASPVVKPVATAGKIDSLETAERAWRAREIRDHQRIWEEESGPDGDPFTAGLAAFRLASVTEDPAWSNAAIDAFDNVLERNPDLALARAWRGSAHALAARDYPIQGLLQIIPGPGFVRLHHVHASTSDLDAAADAAPRDPVVRLVRASTYVGLPAIFGKRDEGFADFDELEGWTNDPQGNPDHADVLRSESWRESYYLSRSRAMRKAGRNGDAVRSWAALAGTTRDPLLQELAEWHRISLGASR